MAREREEGLAALQRGDLPTAAIMLEQVVRQNKDDFESHLYLGGVYHQMKRHGDAVRVLTRATELQPDNPQARFNLGIAQEQSGNLIGAQASFQQAILLQAEYPVAHEALERVEARLNGPIGSPEPALDTALSSTIATGTTEEEAVPYAASASYVETEMQTVQETKPLFSRPVNSSFGSAPPASAPASTPSPTPASPEYAPTSSATPAFLTPPTPPTTDMPTQPTYGAAAYGSPAETPPTYAPPFVPGAPPPPNPYAPGYGANPYAPPAVGYQAQPHGQPPPYGPPPYGQPPYGAGYAPPGVYNYGGAQQYVVTQQPVPQEATIALILSILGLPVVCTGLGVVFSPISLYLALKAKRMQQADPRLGGQGTVTAALWLSWIGLGLNVLLLIAFFIAMIFGN